MPIVRLNPPTLVTTRSAAAAARAPRKLLWNELWELFQRSRESGSYGANRSVRQKSIDNYKWDFDKLTAYMQKRGLNAYQDMSDHDIEDFIVRQQRRVKAGEITQSSANHIFRSLKAIFNFIELCPECEGLRSYRRQLPKIPKNPPRPYIPSQDVVTAFMGAFDKGTRHGLRDYTVCSLVVSAGLRSNEVCLLTLDDVDFKTGIIMVPEEGKTGKRQVPMSPTLAENLKYWLKFRDGFARPGVNNFFLTQYGFPCVPNVFVQSFRDHRISTGVGTSKEGSLSIHALRHYFCTMYLVGGGQIQNLRYITGHESLETLMIYVHVAGQMTHVTDEHRRVDPLARLELAGSGKKRRNR